MVSNDETGTFIRYGRAELQPETRRRVAQANAIIEEYEAKGYALTLRQLYYQMVARGLLANNKHEYGRLGDVVVKGRMAGLISWTAIEDRTRGLSTYRYHESPQEAIRELTKTYRLDKWSHQPMRPEVWVEKEALEGVIEHVCSMIQVDFFSCRGYASKSEMWRAGVRMAGYVRRGQVPIVFHLGDHDPSGMDMTRDITEQLETFCGVRVVVQRLALSMAQVEEWNPPPNPAKTTDSRFAAYEQQFGNESWELDALSPETIHGLIRDAVDRVRDEAKWLESLEQENADRDWLRHISGEEDGNGEEDE